MRLVLASLLFAGAAHGARLNDAPNAPRPFPYGGGQAVFVDFTSATYDITYDVAARAARAKATIRFSAPVAGNPVYDLLATPTSIKLDGERTSDATTQTPDGATIVRVLQAAVGPGTHTLEIELPITRLVSWDGGGVKSAFWLGDLEDRGFLERYLPANFEFDRVPMVFNVTVTGASATQAIYANGEVRARGGNQFTVRYPDYFTASSVYFHTVPEGDKAQERFTYRSVDGRELPVTIYVNNSGRDALPGLRADTERVLAELEGDYGPFLHPSVTIYNSNPGGGMSGMEYAGATVTEAHALDHELTHSYFARGLMPANGNAGWIDEAIASWRDYGYPRRTTFGGSSNMAGRPQYTRSTPLSAYSYGAQFMSYLDGRLAARGGLKPVLRELAERKRFTPYTTADFIQWISEISGQDLAPEFQRHVFSGGIGRPRAKDRGHNPHHRPMSESELRSML